MTGLFFTQPAFADYAEVNRLMRAGQFAEAAGKADQFLAGKPKDPQMRFLKGVVLTEQNKPQDAIVVFTKLIEDFPELPEPYNNLAVLQAGQGQFDKARAALELARAERARVEAEQRAVEALQAAIEAEEKVAAQAQARMEAEREKTGLLQQREHTERQARLAEESEAAAARIRERAHARTASKA